MGEVEKEVRHKRRKITVWTFLWQKEIKTWTGKVSCWSYQGLATLL